MQSSLGTSGMGAIPKIRGRDCAIRWPSSSSDSEESIVFVSSEEERSQLRITEVLNRSSFKFWMNRKVVLH